MFFLQNEDFMLHHVVKQLHNTIWFNYNFQKPVPHLDAKYYVDEQESSIPNNNQSLTIIKSDSHVVFS